MAESQTWEALQNWESVRNDFSTGGSWGSALVAVATGCVVGAGIALARGGLELGPAWKIALAFVVGVILATLVLARSTQELGKWKSSLIEGVLVGVACLLGYLLATSHGPSRVIWLVAASVVVLVGLAYHFSRSTLFLVTLALLGLVVATTLQVGQDAVADDRLAEAKTELTQLMAQRCTAIEPGTAESLRAEFLRAGRWIFLAWPDEDEGAATKKLACSQFGATNRPDHSSKPDDWEGDPFVRHSSDPRVLAMNVARAKLALARAELDRAELALAGARQAAADAEAATPAATADLEAAKADVEVARADVEAVTADVEADREEVADALALADEGPPSSSFIDLLSAGAAAAVGSLPGLPELEFSWAGLAVLALIVLAILRVLAIRASRGGMGPVSIKAPDDQKEALRVYLARNVPEPGSVPGAAAVRTVSDLLAAEPDTPQGLWKVVKAVVDIFNVPTGYEASFAKVEGQVSDTPQESWPAVVDLRTRIREAVNAALAVLVKSDRDGEKDTPNTSRPAAAAVHLHIRIKDAVVDLRTRIRDAVNAAVAAFKKTDKDGDMDNNNTPQASRPGVSVFVSDARTQRELASRVHPIADDKDPWRTAAYWAAAVVLELSVQVPPWAVWRRSASKAISAYFAIDDTGADPDDDVIETALREAPDNGLLLMQLAALWARTGKPVRSFLMAQRAGHNHHHYLVARYRLAVQASLLAVNFEQGKDPDAEQAKKAAAKQAEDPDPQQAQDAAAEQAKKAAATVAVREEICALLDAHASRGNEPAARLRDALRAYWLAPDPEEPEDKFKRAAQLALVAYAQDRARSLERDLRLRRLIPGMLRRKEREATVGLLRMSGRSQTLRREMHDLAQTVEVIATIREQRYEPRTLDEQQEAAKQHTSETKEERKMRKAAERKNKTRAARYKRCDDMEKRLLARAKRPEAGWQLAYNMACLLAVRADLADHVNARKPDKTKTDYINGAFDYFWRALGRSGSSNLKADWVEKDPDLKQLKDPEPDGGPRWQALIARLERMRRGDEGDAARNVGASGDA